MYSPEHIKSDLLGKICTLKLHHKENLLLIQWETIISHQESYMTMLAIQWRYNQHIFFFNIFSDPFTQRKKVQFWGHSCVYASILWFSMISDYVDIIPEVHKQNVSFMCHLSLQCKRFHAILRSVYIYPCTPSARPLPNFVCQFRQCCLDWNYIFNIYLIAARLRAFHGFLGHLKPAIVNQALVPSEVTST